jgi:hypothetical protein
VFDPPFDTGHLLALRAFPQNSFAPYQSAGQKRPTTRGRVVTVEPTMLDRHRGGPCAALPSTVPQPLRAPVVPRHTPR